MSLVSMLYNIQLMKYAGEDGIAAYGVLMYVSLIFQAVFIGYSAGSAPVVGYHYGAGNHQEMHGLLKKSCRHLAAVWPGRPGCPTSRRTDSLQRAPDRSGCWLGG